MPSSCSTILPNCDGHPASGLQNFIDNINCVFFTGWSSSHGRLWAVPSPCRDSSCARAEWYILLALWPFSWQMSGYRLFFLQPFRWGSTQNYNWPYFCSQIFVPSASLVAYSSSPILTDMFSLSSLITTTMSANFSKAIRCLTRPCFFFFFADRWIILWIMSILTIRCLIVCRYSVAYAI